MISDSSMTILTKEACTNFMKMVTTCPPDGMPHNYGSVVFRPREMTGLAGLWWSHGQAALMSTTASDFIQPSSAPFLIRDKRLIVARYTSWHRFPPPRYNQMYGTIHLRARGQNTLPRNWIKELTNGGTSTTPQIHLQRRQPRVTINRTKSRSYRI